ncbi:hypothetical protein FRB99_008055 [Tulasnella sp. 403]|nr:hypothetical protein FRB99_008055 [Tulasnella sp. 403]
MDVRMADVGYDSPAPNKTEEGSGSSNNNNNNNNNKDEGNGDLDNALDNDLDDLDDEMVEGGNWSSEDELSPPPPPNPAAAGENNWVWLGSTSSIELIHPPALHRYRVPLNNFTGHRRLVHKQKVRAGDLPKI